MKYMFLAIAIVLELIATSALNKSEQFTKLTPSVISLVGYALAFYFLSHALKTMPVGIAYAIWSGAGILLITVIGAVSFKQMPDIPAIIGLALIVIGIVIINVFSTTSTH
jgi:small multidrug resistance pump